MADADIVKETVTTQDEGPIAIDCRDETPWSKLPWDEKVFLRIREPNLACRMVLEEEYRRDDRAVSPIKGEAVASQSTPADVEYEKMCCLERMAARAAIREFRVR